MGSLQNLLNMLYKDNPAVGAKIDATIKAAGGGLELQFALRHELSRIDPKEVSQETYRVIKTMVNTLSNNLGFKKTG